MAIFKGAGVALITPMKENYEVDYEKLAELLDFQIENKTDAIIVCGTTGEPSTLTEDEHSEVIAFAVKHVNKRVPVIAGTGSNSTVTAVKLSKQAQEDGADGLLVVTPYYNRSNQNGLYEHYKIIAESADLPIIIYNVPARTGCNILPETVVRLGRDVKNIVAIKEASGNISQIAKVSQLSRGVMDVYSGNDDQIVPILALGAIGVISVLSNVAPKQTHDMCEYFFNGDTEKAANMQLDAIPLVDALFCEVNPIPVKTALNMMGMNVGPLRMPLYPMSDEHREQLKKALIDYGIKVNQR